MGHTFWKADYITNFSCVGSQCVDTCCKNWKVFVDKESYNFYKSGKNEVLSPLFEKCINKNQDVYSDNSYGTIELTSEGTCPFLTEKNLCQIHLEYGSEGLCKTCKSYPRTTNKVNKEYYQTGDLSCPEMTRLILLSPELPKWNVLPNIGEKDLFISKQLETNRNYTKNIHQVFMNIMKMQEYTLSKRLWLIGAFIQELHIQNHQENHKAIKIAVKKVNELKKYTPTNFIEQKIPLFMQGIITIISNLQLDLQGSSRLQECLSLFQEGIKIELNKEYTIEELCTQYQHNYQNHYQPFMRKHNYILENYCMHYFMDKLFPYPFHTLAANYIIFILCYAIQQFILVGISASSNGLNKEVLIQLFQSFSKTFEHNGKRKETYILSIYNQLYKDEPGFNKCLSILLSD
ncbi:flagellin lysine-N-methylase [Bacillus cereus]|uniref:flagellin lysine-N-methylase n=1 Tax=Bacillus cereus TaxID=1396 RepID=UPI002D781483|nr:flagellin lysine-N-methylase [Bacillus cereus]